MKSGISSAVRARPDAATAWRASARYPSWRRRPTRASSSRRACPADARAPGRCRGSRTRSEAVVCAAWRWRRSRRRRTRRARRARRPATRARRWPRLDRTDRAKEAVGRQVCGAEHLGEPAAAEPALILHLPQPILRVRVTEAVDRAHFTVRSDVRDAIAIAGDRDGRFRTLCG